MKKSSLITGCLLLLMSCQSTIYDHSFLKRYVYEGASGSYIIIPINQYQYMCIYNDVLNQVIYKNHYQETYKDYLSFLYTLFNNPQKTDIIQHINRKGIFDVAHSIVWEDYKQIGFKRFVEKYMIEDGYGNLKSNLSVRADILVVAKIMFDNGYFVYFGDYIAEFYFSKEMGIIYNEE